MHPSAQVNKHVFLPSELLWRYADAFLPRASPRTINTYRTVTFYVGCIQRNKRSKARIYGAFRFIARK